MGPPPPPRRFQPEPERTDLEIRAPPPAQAKPHLDIPPETVFKAPPPPLGASTEPTGPQRSTSSIATDTASEWGIRIARAISPPSGWHSDLKVKSLVLLTFGNFVVKSTKVQTLVLLTFVCVGRQGTKVAVRIPSCKKKKKTKKFLVGHLA